jgi:hypothetical protein
MSVALVAAVILTLIVKPQAQEQNNMSAARHPVARKIS